MVPHLQLTNGVQVSFVLPAGLDDARGETRGGASGAGLQVVVYIGSDVTQSGQDAAQVAFGRRERQHHLWSGGEASRYSDLISSVTSLKT